MITAYDTPTLLAAPYLICLVGAATFGFLTFDRLLRLEYEEHHAEWIRDGKPDGIILHFQGGSWIYGTFARNKVGFRWLFRTPGWMQASPQAMRLLRRFRVCVAVWNIGLLTLLAIVAVTIRQ